MNGHPQPEELDLLALGALDPAERQALEAHVRGCAECQRRLEEARGRLALLSLSAPTETPSPKARQRLLDRIKQKPSPQPGPAFQEPRRSIWQGMPHPAWSVTVLLLLATIWLGLNNMELRRLNSEMQGEIAALDGVLHEQEQVMARAHDVLDILSAPDSVRVTLVAGDARPLPQGRAFYHARKGLVFTASNLQPPPSGKTYQLWLIPTEGKPISAGVFDPDAQGAGTILLPPLPAGVAAKAFAVTVEPAGGVPQPTGPIVLLGAAG
jgi:anti-sigma-K factor RskA